MVTYATIDVLVVSPDSGVVGALEQVGRQANGLLLIRPNRRQFVLTLRQVQPRVVIVQLVASQNAPQALEWITLIRDRWPWVRRIAMMLGCDEHLEIVVRAIGIDFFLHADEPSRLLGRVLADILSRTPSRAGPGGNVSARWDDGTPGRNSGRWPHRVPTKQPQTLCRNASTYKTIYREKGELP